MKLRLWAAPILVGLFTGCQAPQPGDYISSRPLSAAAWAEYGDAIWEESQNTLREHEFKIDRVDRRAGLITTRPEPSRHFFEFWRQELRTAYDVWEATINPLRRWIEVKVIPSEASGEVELAIVAHKERLSVPDRQFNSTGAAYQYFSGTLPAFRQIRQLSEGEANQYAANSPPALDPLVDPALEGATWIDRGRDPALEEYLLRTILERAGLSFTPDTPEGSQSPPLAPGPL